MLDVKENINEAELHVGIEGLAEYAR